MDFGSQTIGFAGVTRGEPDVNGVRPETPVQIDVSGCLFRPLRAGEVDGPAEVATGAWQCTAPPDDAVLAMTSIDELVYDGTDTPERGDDDANVWEIDGGAMPFPDETGDVFKVTVIANRTNG